MANQQDSQSQQSTPSSHPYRTYSSLYYNADNHDQGPVSPMVTTRHDQLLDSGLSTVHHGSLVSPITTDISHDERFVGLDGLETFDSVSQISPVMSRPGSSESDQNSSVSGMTVASATFPVTPLNIRPAPAFIAHFGAVQVVSEHQLAQNRSSNDDEPNSKDDVQFSEAALSLVNSFLDHLLYSILSQARSTNLSHLKPAMVEVLRRRLARDAIASADEELRELLAENDEEEELNTQKNSGDRNGRWDLELIWRRTRLRVMVYMRLGELEDEDEERYIKEEELLHGSERRFSQSTGLVSWAAAIFLTSILEYIAEQTLRVAGQAAYTRVRRSSRVQRAAGLLTSAVVIQDPITVEEHDVEKVALDTALGRSWRTWRKSTRNTASAVGYVSRPSASRDSEDVVSRHSSFKSASSYVKPRRNPLLSESPQATEFGTGLPHQEQVLAYNIPLPLSARDIEEIEVPGLAADPDAEGVPPPIPLKSILRRRKTLTDMPPVELMGDLPVPVFEDDPEVPSITAERPSVDRRRSASAPPQVRTSMPTIGMPGAFPVDVQGADKKDFDPDKQVDDAVPGENSDVEEKPEPKANAAEMAPYKRASQIPLEFRSADSGSEVTQASADLETSEPVSDEPAQQHSLVGSAIATASATVAATAALVSTALNTAETSEQEKVDTVHDRGEDAGEMDMIDRRKSLVDIKAALTPSTRSAEQSSDEEMPPTVASRDLSLKPAETPVAPAMLHHASTESFTLGAGNPAIAPGFKPEPQKRSSMSGSMLTASARVRDNTGAGTASTDRSQSSTPGMSDTEQQVRAISRRSSRLYLGNMLEDSPPRDKQQLDDSQTRSDSPYDMRDGSTERQPASSGSHQSGERPLTSVEEARSSLTRPPGRRTSVPGLALTNQLTIPEKSSRRQSRNATLDKLEGRSSDGEETAMDAGEPLSVDAYTYDAPRSRLSMREAVEHQYVASPRYHEAGNTEIFGLTSASIRGPEDFDLFVPNDDSVAYESALDSAGEGNYSIQRQTQYHDQSPDAPAHVQHRLSRSSLPQASRDMHEDTRSGRSQTTKHVTSTDTYLNQTSLRDKRRSVSRPPQRNTSVHKSGLMAREPRVMTDSTRDFADFIRSTGPVKEPEVLPLLSLANRSTTSLHSLRSAHINGSRASLVGRTKSLTRSTAEADNIPPVPTMPPGTSASFRSLMQPRGATGKESGNSELIDFIRSGPMDLSTHRISRTVAPFRSTMDSDQLNDVGNRINVSGPVNLTLNTNIGSTQGPRSVPYRASFNDRYPMVSPISPGVSTLVHPAHSGGPAILSNVIPSPESPAGGEILRKRYRAKDPYAAYDADLLDDGDNILTALPNSSAHKEESLDDFLTSSAISPSTKDFVSGVATAPTAHAPVHSPLGTRDGVGSSETSDLADFLRTSGPREENLGAPAPVVSNLRRGSTKNAEAGRRKSGFFGVLARARSRRSTAAKTTYLDLR